MFSLLSQGYGTWDGTAKRDVQEVQDQKDYFSLEDFHLPVIGSNTRTSVTQEVGKHQTGPRYENKPFHLPKVSATKPNPLPKTYTTRKGALLLYTEDCFLPGSSRPWKKRRKLKKEPSVMLKTLGDLRNVILDYKNGGDPLFLALLQKRLSGLKRHSVRPGFSPKRYIAVLGNSLEEDAWNRLAAAGSLKDAGLAKNAELLPPISTNGPICNLFPDKPQPYSTLSLPPVSPTGSMFASSFNFYKNGMSTGAASLISINSEEEEYVPSSRAVSPSESLSNRLSEVEFLPRQRDQYSILNARQKEDILSHLLLQKTLDSLNSDLHGWATHDLAKEGDRGYELPHGMDLQLKTKFKHPASVTYEPLPPIPHFPPIQSAVAEREQNLPTGSANRNSVVEHVEDVKQDRQGIAVEKQVDEDMLDLDAIRVELTSSDGSSVMNQLRAEGSGGISQLEGAAINKLEEDLEEEKFLVSSNNQKQENGAQEGGSPEGTMLKNHVSGESIKAQKQNGEADLEDVAIDDSMVLQTLDHKNKQEDGKDTVESVEDESIISKEGATSERGSSAGHGEPQLDSQDDLQQPDNPSQGSEVAAISHGVTKSDEEDEGIGLDGGELNDERVEKREEEMNVHHTVRKEETVEALQQGQSPNQFEEFDEMSEKPSYFNLEDLQGEVRGIANKVLSRPQSGVLLMEDVKAAMVMWADRLSHLLGPPNQDARVRSAGRQRGRAAGGGVNQNDMRKTAHIRQRKVTRSAVPSLVALRQALEISGGEVPGVEALRNLPPLPRKFTRSQLPSSSGVSSGQKVKRDEASSVHSGSLGSSRSITWERISNADVQVDTFDYVAKDEDPSFQREQADEVVYEDLDDSKFQEAVSAVVTEVKNDYNFVNVKSKKTVFSPKKEEKPFQFPRPTESKPPTKQEPPTRKGKEKVAPKKAGLGKKKAAKKPVKQQQQKLVDKTRKVAAKEKEETLEKDDLVKVEEVKLEQEKETKPNDQSVTVDSETGNWEVNSSERTIVSSLPSPPASGEIPQSEHNSPAPYNVTSSPGVPHIVPKPPDLHAVKEELEQEHSSGQEAQKPQESRATKRAAERAAAAEKRRQEVERKRREREEAKKRAMEEEARLEQIRLEAEMEMRKREEERRQLREEKEEANRRKIDEEVERERLAKIKAEKERRAREEWKKRQQQVLARRKLEDEIRKEREKIEEEIEAARLKEEGERIKAMEESERIAFLEKVRREEEELRLRLEKQKKIEEEEKLAQEEEIRQRQEALALLRQKHLQRHLFISGILKEKLHLSLSHRLTKAFTFSYFNLIPWNHLLHLAPGSPVRVLLHEVKKNIPATIIEEEEQLEN